MIFIFLTLPIAIPMNFILRSDWGNNLVKGFSYYPRFLHWIFAIWGGYFWIPCDLCGKSFGGHELSGSLNTSAFGGVGVCRNCIDKANEINRENWPRFKHQLEEHYMNLNIR